MNTNTYVLIHNTDTLVLYYPNPTCNPNPLSGKGISRSPLIWRVLTGPSTPCFGSLMTDLQLKIKKQTNGSFPVCPRLDLIPKALPSPLQIPLIQDADPGHTSYDTSTALRPRPPTPLWCGPPWPYCCIICIIAPPFSS